MRYLRIKNLDGSYFRPDSSSYMMYQNLNSEPPDPNHWVYFAEVQVPSLYIKGEAVNFRTVDCYVKKSWLEEINKNKDQKNE